MLQQKSLWMVEHLKTPPHCNLPKLYLGLCPTIYVTFQNLEYKTSCPFHTVIGHVCRGAKVAESFYFFNYLCHFPCVLLRKDYPKSSCLTIITSPLPVGRMSTQPLSVDVWDSYKMFYLPT